MTPHMFSFLFLTVTSATDWFSLCQSYLKNIEEEDASQWKATMSRFVVNMYSSNDGDLCFHIGPGLSEVPFTQ